VWSCGCDDLINDSILHSFFRENPDLSAQSYPWADHGILGNVGIQDFPNKQKFPWPGFHQYPPLFCSTERLVILGGRPCVDGFAAPAPAAKGNQYSCSNKPNPK
jgi:hypothetical protein